MVYRSRRSFRKKGFTPRRRKRWSLTAGVKLPGGYGGSLSFNSKRSLQKRAMYAIAKKAVRSVVTPKSFDEPLVSGNAFLGDTIYTHNILDQIIKGTDDANRMSEVIYLKNIYAWMDVRRFQISTDPGYEHDTWLRLMLVKSREEVNSNGLWVSGLGASDLFKPYTNASQLMVVPTSYEHCQVLYDKVFKVGTGDVGVHTKDTHIKFNVPLDTKFTFKDGEVYGRYHNYYLIAIVHNAAINTGVDTELQTSLGYHVNWSDTK